VIHILFVALVIPHEKCMRHNTVLFMACVAVQCVSILSHKCHDFCKKNYGTRNVHFDSLYNFHL